MVERDALNYLLGVAQQDTHRVRLQARLEQMDPDDVLEVADMAIRELASVSRWVRRQADTIEDDDR